MCLGAAELLPARRWLACVRRAADLARLLRGFLRCERLLEKRHGVGGGELTPTRIPPAIDRFWCLFFPWFWSTVQHRARVRRSPQDAWMGSGRQRRRPRCLFGAVALPTLPCGETRAGPEEKTAPRALAESWLKSGGHRETCRGTAERLGSLGKQKCLTFSSVALFTAAARRLGKR